ncbi:type II toxin-antitoxin system PemI/MazE family antitoxin [Enterococcus sp.]|uniref:type II toxin-antitoxin system PemI/MazE family antitoxin n=1 Tax=Enterococcus sp. TaxID=35783 RepID=UPI00289D7096|nr:AbrB family transcriptional regulator [Enterococcus sp.]
MDTVRTSKHGNAVMVTLASKFEVPEGKPYYISKADDGTISLIPKIVDYFVSAQPGEYVDEEDDMARNFSISDTLLDDE